MFRHAEPTISVRRQGAGVVLVVDDDSLVRVLARAQLQGFGYEVIEACDGVEAVETFRLRKETIDLVLLDLSMPRMDGWETLTALRALLPQIPVIIASGYDEAQAMQGFYAERPQAFLPKPYKMADLKLALDQTKNAPSEGGKTSG